ncbi:MAG: metallophosphoesterase [Planctomycetota bacterium]|jgi:hypothetical protein
MLITTQAVAQQHFTISSDMRYEHGAFDSASQAMNSLLGGPGMFHITVGDFDDRAWENRAVIDSNFGADAVWYPIIGNHEEEDGVEMEWLRNEYDNGNGVRTPLSDLTNDNGPTGTRRTTYSWDDPTTNTHYIALNEYWNGGTREGEGKKLNGADTAADGDIVPELLAWLAADLAANRDKAVFVFGHEPAYPLAWQRHVGDSLDAHPANRDAFWDLLEAEAVQGYFCGHTHQYARHQPDGDVWHVDAGSIGTDAYDTFIDVVLLEGAVRYDVYGNITGTWQKFDSWTELALTFGSSSPGDFDGDGDVDLVDVELLCSQLGDGDYDLDGDGDSDSDDLTYLLENLVELSDESGRVGTKAGDFNLDGYVNGTDLSILKVGFGQMGLGYGLGDSNGDGLINGTDVSVLKMNFGYAAPGSSVPEPTTLALMMTGMAAVVIRRRR